DRTLGEDNGDQIFLRSGRFGPYVQRGEVTEEVKKPARASLPKGWSADDMDLEKALTLLSLPRAIGPHPDDGEMIEAGIGRYGPFVKHGRLYANLKEVDEVFTIGMNRAVEELAKKAASRGQGRGAAAKPLKELGEHPEDGGAVNVMDGRYGPYVKWEKINATLPKDVEADAVTMDMAVALIAEKAAKSGKGKRKGPAKKKAASK
ncbi:MAG: topoisomerase C-terminal repeat-containing protein, partial [Pseudomonadota bacterium]